MKMKNPEKYPQGTFYGIWSQTFGWQLAFTILENKNTFVMKIHAQKWHGKDRKVVFPIYDK